jgi:AraC-like DNA-binding protein
VINEQLKKNFHELINKYRVKEARKMLTSPDTANQSVLEIGYEVGFNSKSAFNRAFKHFTQLTPSQFRKKYKRTDS